MDDVLRMIDERLKRIELKVDGLSSDGCAKSAHHDGIVRRVESLEVQAAEGRGRIGVVMMISGAAIAAVFQWLGKHV